MAYARHSSIDILASLCPEAALHAFYNGMAVTVCSAFCMAIFKHSHTRHSFKHAGPDCYRLFGNIHGRICTRRYSLCSLHSDVPKRSGTRPGLLYQQGVCVYICLHVRVSFCSDCRRRHHMLHALIVWKAPGMCILPYALCMCHSLSALCIQCLCKQRPCGSTGSYVIIWVYIRAYDKDKPHSSLVGL